MTDEQEVKTLEQLWINAFIQRDITALNYILADDFVFTDPNGLLKTKDQWLSELSSGTLSVESLDIDDLRIKVSDNIATADVFLSLKAKSIEGGYDGQYHSVDVFEKRKGRWQVVVAGAKRAIA
jgi:ketosteroid isomerase-like protein